MPDQPNILLLLTDQQRYDTLGANGATVCRTPHIDALAARGVNFDAAYTCISLCTPARASLFTGRLPHKHGLVRNTDMLAEAARQIPTTIPTIAERLNGEGYRCALEGKWHAGDRTASQCGFEGLDVLGYGDATATEAYEQHLKKHGLDKPELTPVGSGWAPNVKRFIRRVSERSLVVLFDSRRIERG